MPLFAKFSDALPYTEFMARFGTPVYDAKWRDIYAKVQMTVAQRDLLAQFKRRPTCWCSPGPGAAIARDNARSSTASPRPRRF